MSKKSKLILATAVFGAALFGASCGGGGDGGGVTAAAPTPPPTPPTPPGPTVEGKVLALLNPVTVGAGAINPVVECRLMSNNRAECGNDLNPNADVELHYVYEFENGNVVLRDSNNRLYFFNGTRVERLTSFRRLDGTTGSDSGGIRIPSDATYYATSNFIIMLANANNAVVAVSRDGRVIQDNVPNATYFLPSDVGVACEVVRRVIGGTPAFFRLNVDGTSTDVTATTPDEVLVSAGDRFLVRKGREIRLTSDRCSITGSVLVATITSTDYDAKMVKVGNDFYIAVRDDTNLHYRRVSGSAVTVRLDITLASSPNKYFYALDGMGRLYAITAANRVRVFNIDGTQIGNDLNITNVTGLLGLADRALAKASSEVYEIIVTGFGAIDLNRGATLHEVVDKCTRTNTISVNGAGTNFIRCAHNDGLYILTYDSGSGVYFTATRSITGGVSEVKWATDKVLVQAGATIHLCTTRVGATSISCDETDLPALDPTDFGSYLKFNGDNVFYLVGTSAPYTLKVGDIFGTQTTLPIRVNDASGGNASSDLRRFAFSFGPDSCRNQILYLSSPTASPKTYTIVQPSNVCVTRILKVY